MLRYLCKYAANLQTNIDMTKQYSVFLSILMIYFILFIYAISMKLASLVLDIYIHCHMKPVSWALEASFII